MPFSVTENAAGTGLEQRALCFERTSMTDAIELRFKQELAKTPDPVEFALTFPKRMAKAIAAAKRPEEANEIRALASMGTAYLKQALPRVVQERHDRYSLMTPTEQTYVEASAKAGALWGADPERAAHGGDRPGKKDPDFDSAKLPSGKSSISAGFKGPRDATTCERVGELDKQDRDLYYNERIQNEDHITISGAERVWRLLNPNIIDIPLPDGKFRVIYADPPWDYGAPQHSKDAQETVLEIHYRPLKLGAICDMQIPAGDDAVLFLWATSPLLLHALEVAKAWGFEYKGMFVWDKVKHNVGYYNSVRHELLLICSRGSCLPDNAKLFDSVYSEERTGHSRKPEEFRKIIDQLYDGGKKEKLQLFAREDVAGWTCWGNEAE